MKKTLLVILIITSSIANGQKKDVTFYPFAKEPKGYENYDKIYSGNWDPANLYPPSLLLAFIVPKKINGKDTNMPEMIALTINNELSLIKYKETIKTEKEDVFSVVYEDFGMKVVLSYDGKYRSITGNGSGGYFMIYYHGELIHKQKFYWTM